MVSFDPRKLTQKSSQVLSDALQLAKDEGHQQLAPIHIAVVLFEDPTGASWNRLRQAVSLGLPLS